ncbi:YqiA/YcfP family alpha/beta fold hydrolase [Ferrimonas gelatinilytica]|uniref:Esterase n=1 Tax=Ferrimonas gelatinilytica TaxID=1255257 RepID=A0ABP9S6U0_9GAMM
MLLYLHGFNSAPSSVKAQQVARYLARYHPEEPISIPHQATAPAAAMAQLLPIARSALEAGEPLRLMGSSLGGYLASYLVERLSEAHPCSDIRAVLVNPAVRPYELLSEVVGEQVNPYTGERYRVEPEHMEELKELDTPVIRRPEAYKVLLQSGDEVLDYRQAVQKYQCCELLLEPGGDHSFVGFEAHIPAALGFLGLKEPALERG